MVGAVKLSKYVIPRTDNGIKGVVIPLGILLTGYIILNKTGLRIPVVSDMIDRTVIPIQHAAHDIKEWADGIKTGWSGVGSIFGPAFTLLGEGIDMVGVQMMGGIFFLTPDSGKHGDHIYMAARGLKPSTPLKYGWRSNVNFPGYEAQYTSNADGTWTGPEPTAGQTDVYIIIDRATPLGDYKVYLDQRPWGGGYGERNFRVIG